MQETSGGWRLCLRAGMCAENLIFQVTNDKNWGIIPHPDWSESLQMAGSPLISVVVIARNESSNLRCTVENLQQTLPDGSEIMVVDDGSDDSCSDFLRRRPVSSNLRLIRSRNLGVARSRNVGARRTRGEVIVFADAHIRLPANWWKPRR